MLAEDHKIVRQGLAGLLEDEEDFTVIAEAENGQQAVELAGQYKPDVIVMDINMPLLNGIEATQIIKQENPGIQIIGLSVNIDEKTASAMRCRRLTLFIQGWSSGGFMLRHPRCLRLSVRHIIRETHMSETQFLLYLKALIWSVFVSYTNTTVQHLAEALNKGSISGDHPELQDTHLGICLRYFLAELRTHRSGASSRKHSIRSGKPPSLIYKNKVIEVGHYVITAQPLEQVPDNCYGVVHCRNSGSMRFPLSSKASDTCNRSSVSDYAGLHPHHPPE